MWVFFSRLFIARTCDGVIFSARVSVVHLCIKCVSYLFLGFIFLCLQSVHLRMTVGWWWLWSVVFDLSQEIPFPDPIHVCNLYGFTLSCKTNFLLSRLLQRYSQCSTDRIWKDHTTVKIPILTTFWRPNVVLKSLLDNLRHGLLIKSFRG